MCIESIGLYKQQGTQTTKRSMTAFMASGFGSSKVMNSYFPASEF